MGTHYWIYCYLGKQVEKAMAPHSSTLAWKIPWMEEPGRLQSMGSRRVRHNWATSLSFLTFMHWRRKWQPTSLLLHGKSHGQRSLVGYSPWGHKESDTIERLHFHLRRLTKEASRRDKTCQFLLNIIHYSAKQNSISIYRCWKDSEIE